MDDTIFELIENAFSLNKPQVLFANYILKEFNKDYNQYHFIEEHDIQEAIKEHFDCELTRDDISYTLDRLEHALYLIDKHYNYQSYKLTHNGREILQKDKELLLYLVNEVKSRFELAIENIKEKTLKEQIDNLTIRQLNGSIFHVNKWWLILIINAIVTIIVSVIVALIIFKLGLKD
jgi:hypothetical protein